MTQKEFYNAVINANFNDELTDYATAALEKLNRPKKANPEQEQLMSTIMEVLVDEPQIASEIAAQCNISTQKASSYLRKLVATSEATVTTLKTSKGVVKAYARA